MNVIDLFSGIDGWGTAFKDRGHRVLRVDNNKKFKADISGNILDVKASDFPFKPDIILASPPCQAFSLLNLWRNWTSKNHSHPHQPLTVRAKLGIKVLKHTLALIEELQPKYFIIENPRGKMRFMECMGRYERRTVAYCQYGMRWQKPTDLWGGFPPSLVLKQVCAKRASCHEHTNPGKHQGITSNVSQEVRSEVPYALALDVCLAAEADLASDRPATQINFLL